MRCKSTRLREVGSSTNFLSIERKDTIKPLVTFIDDDGKGAVWTRLKPIFESKGVPCTLAIVSDWVDTPGYLSKNQIIELQNDLGWEVASHQKTHAPMSAVTDIAVIKREVVQSKEELLLKGFNVSNIVYPYGQYNDLVIKEVLKNYRFGVTTNSSVTVPETNLPSMDRTILKRTSFGSYAGERIQLQHYKEAVDKAETEKSWLIFMMHVNDQDTQQDANLSATIDYIKSKGIEIVNLNDGSEYFGHRLDIPGVLKVGSDNVLTIISTSKVISDKYTLLIKDTLINTAAKADDINFILSQYNKNTIIHSVFTYGNATGMPSSSPGLLTTYLETNENGYIIQTYRLYEKAEQFMRTTKLNGTWTPWVSSDAWKTLTPKKKSVLVPLTTFAANETKVLVIDLTGAGTFTTSTSIVATCRDAQIDSFSYNVRVATTTTAKLRLTNLTNGAITLNAADWDFSMF